MTSISNPYLSQRFRTLIWSCLDFELLRTATFFAERYFYVDQENHEARHLFATALLKSGQTQSALHLVDLPAEARCSSCVEIYAQCCNTLGRYRNGREALEMCISDGGPSDLALPLLRESHVVPDEAVLQCRAGSLALKANLSGKAAASFMRALSLNPLLWEAFEGLCSTGTFPDIEELFPIRLKVASKQPDESLISILPERRVGPVATGIGFFTPEGPTASSSTGLGRNWAPQPFRIEPATLRDSIGTAETSADGSMLVYGANHARALSLPQSQRIAMVNGPPLQSNTRVLSSADEGGPALKKARGARGDTAGWKDPIPSTEKIRQGAIGVVKARDVFLSMNNVSSPGARDQNNLRRSTRLLNSAGGGKTHSVKHPPQRDRRKAHYRARSTSIGSDMDEDVLAESPNSPSVSSLAHSPRSDASPAPSNITAAQEQITQENIEFEAADNYIYELMKIFAKATQNLTRYQCQAAVDELDRLPDDQQKSPSVMILVGRAQYELNEYAKAERVFQEARRLDPHRLWDMETYSTLLWHLQRTVKLSFLAQELVSIDARSSQAWIAVGNCFSLQKERAQALTCFRRAAQLDSRCAYAYTLSGHECIDDDVDKAISFFQSALRADPRHYNAWYGLGTCYLRMSKLRLAEYHFRKAADIHPHNAVLLGCVGMAVERRGAKDEAFALFDKAVQLAPDNVLVRYRRAKLLIGMKRYTAAIEDLKTLRDLVPEEANVVFQLARAYRLKGQTPEAQQTLLVARDIAPKDMNKLKRLMELSKDETVGDKTKMEEG
ncbi:TPR-like protein [Ramaria rubella]|nr:TPR-like protein [Ramaria rubella]